MLTPFYGWLAAVTGFKDKRATCFKKRQLFKRTSVQSSREEWKESRAGLCESADTRCTLCCDEAKEGKQRQEEGSR